ncbi:MAG: hypothetical protein WC879_14520 [Melioribacteraceae bacterium]
MKNQVNFQKQNVIIRISMAIVFLSIMSSFTIFAQHQHGSGSGMGNQGMKMDETQKYMAKMQNMMNQMNGLVEKSSKMVSMMKNDNQPQQQSMNKMDMHSKMLPIMQGMENMAKNMKDVLGEIHKTMSNQEMMKNDDMKDHLTDMMDKIESMMDNYDDMLKLMNEAQQKENK